MKKDNYYVETSDSEVDLNNRLRAHQQEIRSQRVAAREAADSLDFPALDLDETEFEEQDSNSDEAEIVDPTTESPQAGASFLSPEPHPDTIDLAKRLIDELQRRELSSAVSNRVPQVPSFSESNAPRKLSALEQ